MSILHCMSVFIVNLHLYLIFKVISQKIRFPTTKDEGSRKGGLCMMKEVKGCVAL